MCVRHACGPDGDTSEAERRGGALLKSARYHHQLSARAAYPCIAFRHSLDRPEGFRAGACFAFSHLVADVQS